MSGALGGDVVSVVAYAAANQPPSTAPSGGR